MGWKEGNSSFTSPQTYDIIACKKAGKEFDLRNQRGGIVEIKVTLQWSLKTAILGKPGSLFYNQLKKSCVVKKVIYVMFMP